jgi:hypothetical protein
MLLNDPVTLDLTIYPITHSVFIKSAFCNPKSAFGLGQLFYG